MGMIKNFSVFYKLCLFLAMVTWPMDPIIAYINNWNYELSIIVQLVGICIIIIMWVLDIFGIKLVMGGILSIIIMITEYDWMIIHLSIVNDMSILWITTIILQIMVGFWLVIKKKNNSIGNKKTGPLSLPVGIASVIVSSSYIFVRHILPHNDFAFLVSYLPIIAIISLVFVYFLIHTFYGLLDSKK